MDFADEQAAAIRRLWTFRAFVWGLRLILIGFVLLAPAYFAPRWFIPAAITLLSGGVVLGIPFRALAFWRLDIPYVPLFMLGLHDTAPPFLRRKPAAQVHNPAAMRVDLRTGLLEPTGPTPVIEMPTAPASFGAAASREDKLAAIRRSGEYRLNVWGYRIMLASLLSCCGGITLSAPEAWTILVPLGAVFVGYLLTVPLRIDSSTRLRLSPGRILGQTLQDVFNPMFY